MKKEQTSKEILSWPLKMASESGITFIDLKRDFAFKWVFGIPGHEDFLLLLLKGILPEKHIRSVQLCPQEQEPDWDDTQGVIYDILCETDDGSYLTIEMQVCSQPDFNDRMVFYSSFPIRNHISKGTLVIDGKKQFIKHKLPPIYIIGILDFELLGVSKSDSIIRHFSIREDEGDKSQFTDSIHYITVELPKFQKESSVLSSFQDMMIYLLKNMGGMKGIPKEFFGKGLDKLLETCMFANMEEDIQMKYVRRIMAEWDREGQLNYVMHTSEQRGLEVGRQMGYKEAAIAMKTEGISVGIISKCTGLSPEQIEAL